MSMLCVTTARSGIVAAHHRTDGNELIFKDNEGTETTRFQERAANRWEGNFCSTTVHYLSR